MAILKLNLFLIGLLFLIVGVFAYSGSSGNYTTRFNEGFTASNNASSSSYSQEFILDDYVVGMYDIIDLIASGRFGVLGRNCSGDSGTWSDWSECVSTSQYRIKRDSTDCILAYETQACDDGGGGGGGGGGIALAVAGAPPLVFGRPESGITSTTDASSLPWRRSTSTSIFSTAPESLSPAFSRILIAFLGSTTPEMPSLHSSSTSRELYWKPARLSGEISTGSTR